MAGADPFISHTVSVRGPDGAALLVPLPEPDPDPAHPATASATAIPPTIAFDQLLTVMLSFRTLPPRQVGERRT
ncbi:hypothetical protein Acsp05_24260 [Actinokineospora sp. NBRC 105648]|nr:hypothetical protein Acsp05_24260 [Actinokineospora sp. NBRC 105648]